MNSNFPASLITTYPTPSIPVSSKAGGKGTIKSLIMTWVTWWSLAPELGFQQPPLAVWMIFHCCPLVSPRVLAYLARLPHCPLWTAGSCEFTFPKGYVSMSHSSQLLTPRMGQLALWNPGGWAQVSSGIRTPSLSLQPTRHHFDVLWSPQPPYVPTQLFFLFLPQIPIFGTANFSPRMVDAHAHVNSFIHPVLHIPNP